MDYLVFETNHQSYAIDLIYVDHVIPVVAITALPHLPKECQGVINLHGEIIPVVNLRACLGLPDHKAELTDHLLLCQVDGVRVAVWVDEVKKVDTCNYNDPGEDRIIENLQDGRLVIEDEGKIIFIFDIKNIVDKNFKNLNFQSSHFQTIASKKG